MQAVANIGIPQLRGYLPGENWALLDSKEVLHQQLAVFLVRDEAEGIVAIVVCCQGQMLAPIMDRGWSCRCGQVHRLEKVRWVRNSRRGYVRVGTKRAGSLETCPPLDEEWEFEIPSESTTVSDM